MSSWVAKGWRRAAGTCSIMKACSQDLARQTQEKLKTARQLYCPLGFGAGAALALLIL